MIAPNMVHGQEKNKNLRENIINEVIEINIQRLKELREDKDLLQKDIAEVLKIPRQNYSRYELGIVTMPIEKYDKLADYYSVSIDYLIGRTDVRKPYPASILKGGGNNGK